MAVGHFDRVRRRESRFIRLTLLAALGLSVAGCVQTGQPERTSRERTVALEEAFIAPPVGGPQILELVEQRYPNATEQRLVLANRSAVPGENHLTVRFFGPVGNTGTGRTPLPNRSIAVTNIAREMREAVPSVPMRRSNVYVQNRYGPFGYGVGRAASGDTCVYAWQRIAGVDTSTLLLRDRGTIEIRLRLCDREAGEERLLHSMYGFTIRAFFSDLQWNPYGAPPEADRRLGALGQPMLPEGARGFEPVLERAPAPTPEAQPAPRRQAAPARAAPAPAAQPSPPAAEPERPPLPAPVGPLVPPPPRAGAAPAPTPEAAASTGSAPVPPLPPTATAADETPAGAALVPLPPPRAGACTPDLRETGGC